MKKCAYMVGIVLFILLLSGCGEVKSELRYDYTKNLTYSGEDKASETFSAIAIKIIEAVNLCKEEVDLSEFDMPEKIIDTAFIWALQSDPMCSFAELKNKEGGVYYIEYAGSDIFVTQNNGNGSFAIVYDRIFLEDWNGYKFILDLDGKLLQETQPQ